MPNVLSTATVPSVTSVAPRTCAKMTTVLNVKQSVIQQTATRPVLHLNLNVVPFVKRQNAHGVARNQHFVLNPNVNLFVRKQTASTRKRKRKRNKSVVSAQCIHMHQLLLTRLMLMDLMWFRRPSQVFWRCWIPSGCIGRMARNSAVLVPRMSQFFNFAIHVLRLFYRSFVEETYPP